MTLILALMCADGVVLASDSQATFETSGQHVKAPTQKLYVPWKHVAWGAAGAVGLAQRVDASLRERHGHVAAFERMQPQEVRKRLTTEVAEVVRPLVQNQYLMVPGKSAPLAGFLFAGVTNQGPVLFEVSDNLMDVSHIDTGFAAIGSGDIFPYYAMAALAHFDVLTRTLDEVKLIAYRVVSDAINVAAFGLGPPVQMVEVRKSPDGTIQSKLLTPGEINILSDTVYAWKSLEAESLKSSLGMTPASASAAGT